MQAILKSRWGLEPSSKSSSGSPGDPGDSYPSSALHRGETDTIGYPRQELGEFPVNFTDGRLEVEIMGTKP